MILNEEFYLSLELTNLFIMNSHDYTSILSSKEVFKEVACIGFKKANTPVWQLFFLAVLTGIYISFGANVFPVAVQQELGKIIAGSISGVAMVMVIIAKKELLLSFEHCFIRRFFHNIITVTSGNIVGEIFIIFIHPSRLQQLFSIFKHKK